MILYVKSRRFVNLQDWPPPLHVWLEQQGYGSGAETGFRECGFTSVEQLAMSDPDSTH